MKTSSRTLMGFGIALAALVIITIVLVLTLGQKPASQLPENTPEGTVQRYLQALQDKNYPAAYALLAPWEPASGLNPKELEHTYESWLKSAEYSGVSTWKATLGPVSRTGTTASVEITIDTLRAEGPLGNPINSRNMTFILKQSAEKWLIMSPIELYWLY